MPVQSAPRRRKKHIRRWETNVSGFNEFYVAYPKKKGKAIAQAKYAQITGPGRQGDAVPHILFTSSGISVLCVWPRRPIPGAHPGRALVGLVVWLDWIND